MPDLTTAGAPPYAAVTVWLTGLPAAGKSTLAAGLVRWLRSEGRPACVLDGDDLRLGLSVDLGFSASDRQENVRRAAEVARLVAQAGVVAVVSLVSPYAAHRAAARAVHARAGVRFIEVFVDTPPQQCRSRDPKGLYARAARGEITHLTGADDPYEPPERPEVRVAAGELAPDRCVELVAMALDGPASAAPQTLGLAQ